MTPYFTDDAAWAACEHELRSWVGTPYKHITMVKGRGADCTLFVGAAWVALGILTALKFDYYPKQWYRHTKDERILENLYRHFREHAAPGLDILHLEPDAELLRGDMLAFSIFTTGVSNHAGVYFDNGQLMHASPSKGVVIVPLKHFLRPRLTHVFRIVRV
jgi:cell wall-associated NlpC family hydrolase